MHALNETHDPALESFVESARRTGSDFPIQNLPFGIFRRRDAHEAFRGGVAIGDEIVDLQSLSSRNLLSGLAADAAVACGQSSLNTFMAMGPAAWSALRMALSRALRRGADRESVRACLIPQASAEHALPARIGDYTDFYASVHHATTVGRLFRPDNPLLPNYKWVPIGYHGRSSSIGVSPQDFHRPIGQTLASAASAPTLGPSKRLDYEVELGIFIGTGNAPGSRIAVADAESHVLGMCLLNDWSARDIQAWEYQPLGPFLSKSFATTISPWIVTLEALAPFRLAWDRAADDPQPLPYLDSPEVRAHGAIDIGIELWLQTAKMREAGAAPQRLSASSFRHAYWTIAQMVAHHTINGCNLQPGDLFGTGTQSGPRADEAGSLLELSSGGKQPLRLDNGETRTFLEDGDTVIIRAACEKPGATRIGFGEAIGRVLPALPA